MIEVIEINSFEELEVYRHQWNQLLQNSETNVIFLTFEYCRSWWEVFFDGRELLVLLARKDSEIIGVAPLTIGVLQRWGMTRRAVEFLGTLQSDYMDFIIGSDKNDVLKAFSDYLWSIRSRWDIVRLRQIPESSSTVSRLQEHLNELPFPFSVRQGSSCPIVLIEGRKEEVENKIRQQRTLRRYINRLEQLGELKFGYATDTQESLSYLDSFFQMHINRWESTVTPSTFYNEDQRRFYYQLARSFGPKGWLRLAYLALDGLPIALIVGFEYNRSLSLHRSAHNLLYYKHSPGRIIVRYAVQYCLDNGLNDVDLLAGSEGYKEYITNEVRQTRQILLYRSRRQKIWDQLKHIVWQSRFSSSLLRDGRVLELRLKLRKYNRRYGVLGLAKKVVRRFGSRIVDFSSNQLFEWCGEDLPQVMVKYPIEIRVGDETDVNLIASFHGYTADAPEIQSLKQRLGKGDKPYLAFCGRTLAHVAWVCKRDKVEMDEIWGSIAFGRNEAYIMDCKTGFVFRGRNIYPEVLQRILQDLMAENIDKVYIACGMSNETSMRSIKKAGFLPAKKISAVKLFGRKIGPKIIPAGS